MILGSLSNDDDDGNENGRKIICLDWQNNKPARARRFFVHFFAVKLPSFTFYGGRELKATISFSFS